MAKQQDPYRLQLHITPPTGWMNDPNGLCQKDGIYHVFFQYGPDDVMGGSAKTWGHYTGTDLFHWKDEGIFLYPDAAFDRDGVYSGCAFTDEEGMHLFYTGNVKEEGDYDYIHGGRGANQVLVTTKDGIHPGKKELLLTNKDYPDTCTCHVRDPRVWREHDRYRMILGARTQADYGEVLVYESTDMHRFSLIHELTSSSPFGYMWECPDYMTFGDERFLSFCPQGLVRENERFQNVYQAGYVRLEEEIDRPQVVDTETFCEWDMGFDFYAPQTFVDEGGRRILIGWMGLPDIEEEYVNPSIAYGWQHALTIPREITCRGKKLYQQPVRELLAFRKNKIEVESESTTILSPGVYDMEIHEIASNEFSLCWNEDFKISYEEGLFSLRFLNASGAGRTVRNVRLRELFDIRMIVDTSAVEIYINQGEAVLSSRYYPEERQSISFKLQCAGSRNTVWEVD